MLSVFSTRYVAAPIAGLLLSLGANAMEGQGQGQCLQDQRQTGTCLRLDKPPVESPYVSCVQTLNEATLALVGDTTVEVTQLRTLLCKITQGDGDSNAGEQEFPVPKLCPPDNSQSCQQAGYHCGPVQAQPLKSEWSKVAEGSKTGTVKYQHLSKFQLTMHGGDSRYENLPCNKVSADEVLAGLPQDLQRNFSLDDARGAISGLISELERNGGTMKGSEKTIKPVQASKSIQAPAPAKKVGRP